MSRICVLLLIGLPGAGKSTFCQKLLVCVDKLPFNVVHLCFDKCFSVTTNFKAERQEILLLLESLIADIRKHHALTASTVAHPAVSMSNNKSNDFVILCDDNNYYASMRYKICQICRINALHYGQLYFVIDVDAAQARNAKRTPTTQVPPDIVQQMSERLEVPDASKHCWELLTLHMDVNCATLPLSNFLQFVAKIWQHNVQLTPVVEHSTTVQSIQHQLDLLLRRRIGVLLNTAQLEHSSKKTKALQLNLQRKQILQQFCQRTAAELQQTDIEQLKDLCKLLH